jgi:transcription elongation factor GreA
MKKTYQLTVAGKEALEKELAELVALRGEIARQIAEARDNGDLAENSEYDAARDRQAVVESRINEINTILLNSTIIKAKASTKIAIGNTIVLDNNGTKKTYTIVGSVEADPLEGRISDESPIGQALLGKAVGEQVGIKTPKGETSYTIVEIK